MSAVAKGIEVTPTLDLTALRSMSFEELDGLYRSGKRPSSIADLDGDAIGAMLAWRSPGRGPLAGLLRSFGASAAFPWEGKTFKSLRRRHQPRQAVRQKAVVPFQDAFRALVSGR